MELTERTDIYDINDRTEKIKNWRQHAVIRHAGGLPVSKEVGFSKVCIGGYERISENPARRIQQSVSGNLRPLNIMANKYPKLEPHLLESICRTIADTKSGITGSEIGKILADTDIDDIDPLNTKWKRLYNAFVNWQNKKQCSNNILKFIQNALQPVRYIGKEEIFQYRRNEINKRISFIGFELSESGKYRKINKSTTISEAEQRANRLQYKLEYRNTHNQVFLFCKAELLVDNYFHAVFEATKSVAERLRNLTGLNYDGNKLVEVAFSTDKPLIKINNLATASERSEHIGFSNLIKGIFGLIRNPTAHEPKITFEINEEEALDLLTTVSLIHKRLDNQKK